AAREVRPGDHVRRLGEAPHIRAGAGLLGRVVDPLGRPLDGLALVGLRDRVPLERPPPGLAERAAVRQPLLTGVLAIDAMFPIGRGQRELILGDEGTGKTSLVVDVLVRQATTDVIGVYVAIGRRRADVSRVAETLRAAGGRWVIVAAPEDDMPGLRYLAPYAGCAIAEHFAARGEHALVVYDDLSAHAVAWRELSLLLRRPAGREAYPGDIFYLHSRLVERATQLSADLGGGSITALPVATLESGRLSAYIPTNLISMTDGQIVLSRQLFAAGHKPAIDAGLSVSRVGGKAQPQALHTLAARLRLEYASFLELEVFARLGTRLEASTARRVEVGRRIRALLRSPRLSPLDVFAEVVRLILASDPEMLLAIPVEDVPEVAERLTAQARSHVGERAAALERDATIAEDEIEALRTQLRRLLAPGAEARRGAGAPGAGGEQGAGSGARAAGRSEGRGAAEEAAEEAAAPSGGEVARPSQEDAAASAEEASAEEASAEEAAPSGAKPGASAAGREGKGADEGPARRGADDEEAP
ncbi:MAG TPA: hypothetical protein RMG95_00730, partial [Polyangiaceae bacterium LLY-WYZ-15_(1-7)]|nr:hypothetical protein [Polyangiaceae bacterium LLY-WYZ-15_(1-7)]